jgi:SAM-dependent methyltransferase
MKFRNDYLRRYLALAPAALAVERVVECEILNQQDFTRPILDIGCGDGIFAQILFDEQLDLGVDIDREEIARASATGAYLKLLACPGSGIPVADGAFKTVLSNSVLEHIPDLMPVLREAHRVLADGGTFYVTLPTDRLEHNSLPARIFAALGLNKLELDYGKFHNRFWRHYNVHSPAGWRALFESIGFSVAAERVYASPNFSSFYDLLMPSAIPSILAKKLYSRWFLFPALRRSYYVLVDAIVGPIHERLKREPGSSLIFFKLVKAASRAAAT